MSDPNVISVGGAAAAGKEPRQAPLLDLKEPVIYPFSLTPLLIEEESRSALRRAMEGDRLLAIFPPLPDDEQLAQLPTQVSFRLFQYDGVRRSAVGVLVRVVKELNFPDGSVRVAVRGVCRINCVSFRREPELMIAGYHPIPESEAENNNSENIARQKSLTLLFQELAGVLPNLPDELQVAVFNAGRPGRFADLLADALNFSSVEKLMLLALVPVRARLELLAVLMNRELEVFKLGMKLQNEVHQAVSRNQRETFLREQLRAIQNELGEDSRPPDLIELGERLADTTVPDKVQQVIEKELERLAMIPQAAPEYHISYTYVTWLLDVPWFNCTDDRLDCQEAAQVLEDDHYGLKDVKERILEFLAVLQLRGEENRRAPILCLVGPPGVGKTSLGQSIARAMNRNFIRVSLGGVRDEAEIRGHRRTYVGALPGRIIQNMKKAGSANPVFMLDEIDKLAHDFRGDPASALLEVLDPAQNHSFNDHYLEVDYDLSKVFFIATANVLDTIPPPLLDRMEIIRLPGYTSFEKYEIARRYLVPRQIKENGLKGRRIRFQASGINELIDHYTREAGVRDLERAIGRVCRRIARRLVEKSDSTEKPTLSVTSGLVQELLGPRKFLLDEAEAATPPGCATGMAWTGAGGVILPIETVAVPGGKGNLKLTGSLGKVMQESAETAYTLIRATGDRWKVEPEYFNTHDFHIHVPDGATPKDGPSAGITLTLALASLLTRKPVRPRLAMTGEITLNGRVTAVGGIREKVIAALRAGVDTVILPEENRKDAEEIPEEIQKQLTFCYIRNFEEALPIAFGE